MSVLADKPTLRFRLLVLPVFLHSYFAVVSFGKGKFKFVVLFFKPFFCSMSFLKDRVRCLLCVFCRQQGPLLVGCKHSSGGRERALLKPFSERPRRTKPLSGSLRILFTLCSCSLWIFNALPSFISKSFHLLAVPGRWFALGGGRRGLREGEGRMGNDGELPWEGWHWAASCWRWGRTHAGLCEACGLRSRNFLLFQLSEADLISCKCQSPRSPFSTVILAEFVGFVFFFLQLV